MKARPNVRRRRCAENDALVLGVMSEANGPLSAYDIADRAKVRGARLVPNQVYRTLARLIERKAVLRIETLNAYISRQSQANVCLICKDCHMVEFIDMPELQNTIVQAAPQCHFEAIDGLIEAQGQCFDCRQQGTLKEDVPSRR